MSDVLDRLRKALADRYAVQREIGSGGMATVYLAEDLKHHRQVAIKVLRPDLAATLGPERFLREIEVAAKLQHPHILPLHDSGEADGFLYYVMPYVEGETLRDRLTRETQLPLDDALQITRDVAAALNYAHNHDVIHRDIKPENVLLSAGEAVVADFGIARAITEAAGEHLTETGISIGTPAYMSPEQASGSQKLDGRSDVYSLGCVLYEMLAGEPPYTGPTAQAVLAKKLSEATPRVSVVRERVPNSVEAAIDQALAKAPADRHATVQRFAEALEGTGEMEARPKAARRIRPVALIGIATAAAVAAVVWNSTRPPARVLDPELTVVLPFQAVGIQEELEEFRKGVVRLAEIRLSEEGSGPHAVASGTVLTRWRDAGGEDDHDIAEDRAIQLAADLGAGSLIKGTLVGYGDSVEVNATVLDVKEAERRHAVRITGPGAEILRVIDQMFIQLLALEGGVDRGSLASLTTTSLPALRAFLKGQDQFFYGRTEDAAASFSTAIREDSTFALAGLWSSITAVWGGGRNLRGGEVARAHRERLSRADQLILDAWLGEYAERKEAVDQLPDRPDAWFLYGDLLSHCGTYHGVRDPLTRADDAFERVRQLNPALALSGKVAIHALEHAALRRDTSRFRVRWDEFRVGSDSLNAGWLWLAATTLGDSGALAVLRDSLPTLSNPELSNIAGWSSVTESGFEDGAAALRILRSRGVPDAFGLSRLLFDLGRPAAAAAYLRPGVMRADTDELVEAILWAVVGDGDTLLARQAAERLGSKLRTPPPSNVEFTGFFSRCMLGLWQLQRGERDEARKTLAAIMGDKRDTTAARRRICGGMMEVSLGLAGGHSDLLDEIDSAATSAVPHWLADVFDRVLWKLYERDGRAERALAVIQRRTTGYHWFLRWGGDAARHRETGRLALIVGDTALAIESFERYLRFRYAPEPALQAEADEVRERLAELVAQ